MELRYSEEHLRRFRRNPVQDDRRERTHGTYISRMGNALDGVNGFYLYYEDNISNDVKNIFLIQQLS